MSAKTPFERMMAQSREMARAMSPALPPFDPGSFEQLWPSMTEGAMDFWFGKGLSKRSLGSRTRLLLTLAGLTMQGAQAETPFRMTVRHVREAGATQQRIAERIAQMSVFAGISAMTRAMALARDVMDERKDDVT